MSIVSADPDVLLEMYADDHLDLFELGWLPLGKWDRVRQRYAEEYLTGPLLNTSFVGYDTTRPPFDDPRVRRAFALATDRESLANVALRGYATPATGGLVPPGMPGHVEGIALPFSPAEARQLLAEAGFPGGRNFPAVEALSWEGHWPTAKIRHLQATWCENLGVEIRWEQIEWNRFNERMYSEVPSIWMAGWIADYPDPDSFLRASGWRAQTGWTNAAYDELVECARRQNEQGERMRLYERAEKILLKEVPVHPLNYVRFHMLGKPWVKNFRIPPMGSVNCEEIIIEPH
jgi:ABC-type oligopeptide transport system substrate-binding subunit